jgi:hypothetical protein
MAASFFVATDCEAQALSTTTTDMTNVRMRQLVETHLVVVECKARKNPYTSTRMQCPNCDTEVDDTASICPNCDAVLDASFLDEPAPKAKRPPSKPAVKPVARKPATRAGAPAVKKRPAPAPKRDEDTPPPKPKEDWRSQVSAEDWNENAGRAPEKFVVDKQMDATESMTEAKQYLSSISMADKLALGGASLLCVSTFLPWAETAKDGDVLGIFSSGVLVTILSALAIAGILVRTRKMMPTMNSLWPWIAQLGAVGISGLWCLVYFRLAWDHTLVQGAWGAEKIWASKPAFGLILALLAGITSVVGTVFGLKDMGK